MKNFDLNAYGVSEMNVAEMQKTDGGVLEAIGWLIIGILISECLDRNAQNDYAEGKQAANDFWN
jgi:hypothetical protein